MKVQSSKFKVLSWIVLLAVLLSGVEASFSQPATIKKSDKIETHDGKKFYIHSVEKGQTLYSIAKTYGTTVDIVLANNPDAVDGLKSGDTLKIPYSGNTEVIKKEIENASTTLSVTKPKKDTIQKRPEVDLQNAVNITYPAAAFQKKDTAVKPIGNIDVALFLPLSLGMMDHIDVGKIAQGDEKMPEEMKIGIEFYEGMKIALDSLKKTGFNGKIHIYDTSTDSAGFARLMQKKELKNMDLFIGPLYGKKFETVLKYAKENNINIVSPTIQGNNMLMGNMNVSKVTPSYVTQADEIAKYVSEKFAGQNIILFNSANPKDKPYINTFKKTANLLLQNAKADTIKEVTFATLKNFISKTKPNIVVIPSTNQSFVTEAVNKLYLSKQENKDSILVFGMSNWQDIESLDFGYLNALHSHVSSYSFTDYSNAETKKFILKYRNEYKTDPTEYVFSGFDAGIFYLSGLQKYGNALQNKLPELKQKGIQTEFNFYQPDIASGYENRGVGILKFENYSYIRVK